MEDKIEQIIYETEKRIQWWIEGMKIHCIPADLFVKIPTERIVELYNVDMDYFIKHN